MIGSIISGLISIAAGIYLISVQARDANSILQIIANGLGWYFVARGIYMMSSAHRIGELVEDLRNTIRGTEFVSADTHKQCAMCNTWIERTAKKCKACGSDAS